MFGHKDRKAPRRDKFAQVARAAKRAAMATRSAGLSKLELLEPRCLLSGSFSGASENGVAIDAMGNTNLAYYDATSKNLKFAVQSSNHVWSASLTVDAGSNVGSQLSLGIAPTGKVGIAYYDAADRDLRFATYARGWRVSTVDAVGVTGQHPSLTFTAAGLPVITYYSPTTYSLRLATQNADGAWSIATVSSRRATSYNDVAIDPATGLPAVAFENTYGSVYLTEKSATGFTVPVLLTTSSGVSTISLAFDPTGHLAVTYYDSALARLKMIRSWRGQYVSLPVAQIAARSDPHASVLINRTTGLPEVIYHDATAGIYRAVYDAPSGSYKSQLLKVGGDDHTTAALLASNLVTYSSVATVAAKPTLSINSTAATPLPPTDVSAPSVTSDSIQLSWTDNSNNETGFIIERSTDGTNFATIASPAAGATSYTDTNLLGNTIYYYRVSAVGADNSTALGLAAAYGQAPGAPWVLIANTSFVGAPQYLLTPSVLADMKAKMQANTPQWQAFKASLDAGLNQVTEEEYQGSSTLPPIGDYALGYQVLEDTDPVTASAYADKALALMRTGLETDIRAGNANRLLLARGDGVTTRFTLPNSDIDAATFKVYTSPITIQAVTKGAPNGQDGAGYYYDFLKVSNTSDGPADYTQGADWQRNSDYSDQVIDWSLGGNQPATGATYYVTEATAAFNPVQVPLGNYTQSGNTLTFNTAPRANQAIYVEYQYGTPTGGASTLGYQQTLGTPGGFNNVFIDATYVSRNLKFIAIAFDWLWSYQGFSASLRSEAKTMLVRWSDYLRDNGYYVNSPSSNYGAGHYAFRMATAIALQGRSTDAPRLMTEMQTYHQNNVLPLFAAPAGHGTEQGGFWAEGWSYGSLSIQNVITSGLAFEAAGWGSAAAERTWAGEVIEALLTQQPSQSTIYEGGDGYAWPRTFPDNYWGGKTLLALTAATTTDQNLASYANWAIQNDPGWSGGWEDLLYNDPSATTAFWDNPGGLPLAYLSAGTGVATARKDWSYNSTWLSFHAGDYLSADHQSNDQGALTINRGGDPLLVMAPAIKGPLAPWDNSKYSNLVAIDDGGATGQRWAYSQGFWYGYGNPDVSMTHFDGATDYTYMQADYAAAYRNETGSNPASELVRDVFFVRSADYVITYDRATTTQASFAKQLQWHFTATPTVSGNSWSVAVGSSKLFGQTFSDTPLSTTEKTVTVGVTVHQVDTNPASPTASVRYVTAMQTSPSGTTTMDPSIHVESGDAQLEGVQIGSSVVLFGRNGAVSGGSGYSVTAAAGQVLTHYISDLAAGATYDLTGADQTSAVADAQGVLSFTTTGTGSPQDVMLTPA